MESESLKILLIGKDAQFASAVTEMLREKNEKIETTTVSSLPAGLTALAADSFHAILFELFTPNTAGLFQVTSLAIRAQRVPVIVFGLATDEDFIVEAVRAGAQDYVTKENLDASTLQRTIRCAIERQHERIGLISEKENYYNIFDHLVEGIFRTTPDGHYLLANVALARIYGYGSPAELMANITDIARSLYVEPGQREKFVQVMQANDTITGFESRIYRKDGDIIWISENCRAVRDAHGELLHYEGSVEDITERKYSEEQIRRTTAELSRSREDLHSKNLQMEENLRMAREVQLAMLLQQYPVFPKNVPPEQSAFQFAHRYYPAETIGGDFFSVSALSDTEVGVFICDVTGHGVRAALVTAMIRALVEELKPLALEPEKFLRKFNSDLFTILKNTGAPMLTTAFYFVANCQTGILRFANAGHPKPLLLRRSENRALPLANASGHSQPALGLFEEPPYQATEIALVPGDCVMLFTDGLYEVQGANEELYSQQRLMLDVQALLQKPAGQLFDDLLEAIRKFSIDHEFSDDVCLIGTEFTGKLAAKKS